MDLVADDGVTRLYTVQARIRPAEIVERLRVVGAFGDVLTELREGYKKALLSTDLEDLEPEAAAELYDLRAEMMQLDEAMVGYVLSEALDIPLPREFLDIWRQGYAVWERLIADGYDVAQLRGLYLAVVHHPRVTAFVNLLVDAGDQVGREQTQELRLQHALWAASLKLWGRTDAYLEQDPDEVSRIVALHLAGHLEVA